MIPKIIAENGNHRLHRNALRKLLDTTDGPVRIASAYVTDTDLLLGSTNRSIRLLTSLWPPDIIFGATSLLSLKSLIKAGVKCRCLSGGPRLHAKVYLFGDDTAVITSANLTRSAFDSNIEVGVQITGSAVQDVALWFDSMWHKSDVLDLKTIDEWDEETRVLRRECARLRKKLIKQPKLPHQALAVGSASQLRQLFENADHFFVCNTNRRWSDVTEDAMRRTKHAADWRPFRFPSHIESVEPGNAIFMFAKGCGIIGIGRAKAGCEILEKGDPARIRDPQEYDEREWRVPVDEWLVWVDDEDACPFPMGNRSFADVSDAKYAGFRDQVRKHFLREAWT